jgi:hypothetical protein
MDPAMDATMAVKSGTADPDFMERLYHPARAT